MNITERIEDVAGYMSERHVWQLLHELSSQLMETKETEHISITPVNILWDEKHFSLAKAEDIKESDEDYRYEAPEMAQGKRSEASIVWSLAAMAFYMHMGSHVFNGRGGKAQEPDSPVPFMRKEMKELSETLAKCLSYDKQKRLTLSELCSKSKKQLDNAKLKPRLSKSTSTSTTSVSTEDFWREEMKEY